jgi:hypothetical protein
MDAPHDALGRPFLDAGLTRLVAALAEASPETLGHVDATRILVVAGAARRSANASIRPLTYGGDPPSRGTDAFLKPSITIDGIAMRYEICLRPRFFLALNADERVRVLAHELWHTSTSFDGTLASDRRHRKGGDDEPVDRAVSAWRMRGAAHGELLAVEGEARLRAWTVRPPSRIPRTLSTRDSYDERDLHHAVVCFASTQLAT